MSDTTAKAKKTTKTADAKKEFDVLFSANQKSLQDAFLSGTEAAENAFKSGTDAFKTAYTKAIEDGKSHVEKAAQSLSEVPMYDKEAAEPFITAGNAVVEKSEKISAEIIDFGTNRVDAYFTATRSVLEAQDVQKAIELQTEYARATAETFVSEASKLNAMFVDATKDMMGPFGNQYAANMDKFLNRA